jgi:hypothetical protein
VFFSGPRETALIEPLIASSASSASSDSSDSSDSNGQRYEAVRSGEHLRAKLQRTQRVVSS